ncbi:MAG TPA: sterol desaturase family protein, partial [Myxococcota bacterium]|nr:sterol desaturase family protein [Myxococcota bacterium]
MLTEEALALAIPLTFVVLSLLEAAAPGREFPQIPLWRAKGVAAVVVLMTINALLPSLLPPDWLAAVRLVDGRRLGVIGGGVVGYLVVSLGNMLVHRSCHRYDWLWRHVHQLHHAPERVDMSGAAWTHPLEVVIMVLVFLGVVSALGLDPVAAALTGYIGAFFSMFQHLNVRTPAWLGYVIERPESHMVHHAREVHALNYSDLPLWDMLFGTFRNPARFEGDVGFGAPASARLGAMLL